MVHTAAVELGEPNDDITAEEINLVAQAGILARSGDSQATQAAADLTAAEGIFEAIRQIAIVEHSDIKGIQSRYDTARGIMGEITGAATRIQELAAEGNIEAEEAELLLGYGEAAIQVHVDHLQGTAEITGILEQIGEEKLVLDDQVDALSELLTILDAEVTLFEEQRALVKENANIVTTADLYLSTYYTNFLSGKVIAEDTSLVLKTSYDSVYSLAYDLDGNKNERPIDLVNQALLTEDLDEALLLMEEALTLSESEKSVAEASEAAFNATMAVGSTSEMNAYLFEQFKSKVAGGLFDVTTNVPTQEIDVLEVKLIDEVQDRLTQASYVQIVNILHSIEDTLINDRMFTSEAQRGFWGVEGLLGEDQTLNDYDEEVYYSDTGVSGTKTRLQGEVRQGRMKENVTDWESTTSLLGGEAANLITDDNDLSNFHLLKACRLASQLKALKSMIGSSSVSAGLTGMIQWITTLGEPLIEAEEEYINASGNTESSAELKQLKLHAVQKSFNAFINLGGLSYIDNLKVAITQQSDDGGSVVIKPSIQDLIFFEYASTGEATLNRRIGELGQTMQTLNTSLEQLNILDATFSRGDLPVDHRGKLADGDNAFSDAQAETFGNALQELYILWKKESSTATTSGDSGALRADQKEQIGNIFARVMMYIRDGQERVDDLDDEANKDRTPSTETIDANLQVTLNTRKGSSGFDVSNPAADLGSDTFWESNVQSLLVHNDPGGTSVGTAASNSQIAGLMYRLFNDENFQQAITNAITFGQGVSDTAKQDLKKVMFVYQEFIKSAGSVMEKISEMIRSMAQKVGR